MRGEEEHLHTEPVSSLCFPQVVALPAERVRFLHHRNTVPDFRFARFNIQTQLTWTRSQTAVYLAPSSW